MKRIFKEKHKIILGFHGIGKSTFIQSYYNDKSKVKDNGFASIVNKEYKKIRLDHDPTGYSIIRNGFIDLDISDPFGIIMNNSNIQIAMIENSFVNGLIPIFSWLSPITIEYVTKKWDFYDVIIILPSLDKIIEKSGYINDGYMRETSIEVSDNTMTISDIAREIEAGNLKFNSNVVDHWFYKMTAISYKMGIATYNRYLDRIKELVREFRVYELDVDEWLSDVLDPDNEKYILKGVKDEISI